MASEQFKKVLEIIKSQPANPNATFAQREKTLGRSASALDSRPRSRVRASVYPTGSCNGDPRSPDRTAFTLAERARRAGHRLDPARMLGSLIGIRREAPAPDPEHLRLLLQRGSDTSLWRKTHRISAAAKSSAASPRYRFSADYIIAMCGFRFSAGTATRLARCSPISTAGSPRASTPQT